ncbi:hypothetical protein AAFF_G00363330, partial [Aldrovandia affinis]
PCRLGNCDLTGRCCADVASVLGLRHSHLRELELRDNDLQDSGVRALSAGLGDPECKLLKLGLSGCRVTEEGCASLSVALCSHFSRLRELDLTYNHLGASGATALSAALEDPDRQLGKLLVEHGGEQRDRHGLLKYACQLELDPSTADPGLSVCEQNRRVVRGSEERTGAPHRPLQSREPLSARCYWEAEWTGNSVTVGLSYRGVSVDCYADFSNNDKSWSMQCSGNAVSVIHDRKLTSVRPRGYSFQRAGVYLDWPAGVLSFYAISSDTVSLLHTVHTSFTEPLYAGFTLSANSSAALCMLG